MQHPALRSSLQCARVLVNCNISAGSARPLLPLQTSGWPGLAQLAGFLPVTCMPSAPLAAVHSQAAFAAAQLPNPTGATLGKLPEADFDRVAKEAARTIPGREHGGNCGMYVLMTSQLMLPSACYNHRRQRSI